MLKGERVNVAVLVSGGGTNLQALLDAQAAGILRAGQIALVVSDREGACALSRAQAAGVEALAYGTEISPEGVRLAGLWPADQMRLAARAGASVFGPAVNVNTGKTVAWNVARTCTICRPCTEAATIPIHLNGGMGVGGVPMHALPPVDAVSRASRACVDLLRLDGL